MILHDLDQTGAIAIVMCHYFHGNICSGNLGKKVYQERNSTFNKIPEWGCATSPELGPITDMNNLKNCVTCLEFQKQPWKIQKSIKLTCFFQSS